MVCGEDLESGVYAGDTFWAGKGKLLQPSDMLNQEANRISFSVSSGKVPVSERGADARLAHLYHQQVGIAGDEG